MGFLDGSAGRQSACHVGDTGSISGWGRSPRGGNGNPFLYPCLENPMVRGAWWATVHGVTKTRIWLKWLSTRAWLQQKPRCDMCQENYCQWNVEVLGRKTSHIYTSWGGERLARKEKCSEFRLILLLVAVFRVLLFSRIKRLEEGRPCFYKYDNQKPPGKKRSKIVARTNFCSKTKQRWQEGKHGLYTHCALFFSGMR